MSIPKMANAVGYTDDDLIAGAMEYKRTKRNGLRKLAALAACLCLILVGVWMVLSRSGSGEKRKMCKSRLQKVMTIGLILRK